MNAILPLSWHNTATTKANKPNFTTMSLQDIKGTKEYAKLLEDLRKKDKTELHAHLSGALSKDFIRNLCSPQEWDEISRFIEKIRLGIDYSKVFDVFIMIRKILNSNLLVKQAAFNFCESQHRDKVTFSELRTGLKNLNGGFENCLIAVLSGLKEGMEMYPSIHVNLILSLRRDTPLQDADETIRLALKYRAQGITGIDVSGQSTKGDGSGIFKALEQARDCGYPITLHIGEDKDETPEQQMKELTKILPQRIGHGVFLCSEAKKWIEDNRIVVEACISSALSVSMITQPSLHPALDLFKKGHPVVFCTDDSTLFGDLSEELAIVACLCDLSIEQVALMQQRAVAHAFKRYTLS